MANGNTTPSRLGQVNATGDATALFLKVFGGEVLNFFNDRTVMLPRTRTKTITSGKVAQFPAIGTASANYHVVGEDILDAGNSYLSTVRHAERLIYIDEVLTSAVFTAEIDEWMNHFETRSEYAKQLGQALAEKADRNLMISLGLAAQVAADALFTGAPGGGNVNCGLAAETKSDLFVDGVYEAAEIMDGKNVPSEDRFVLATPAIYWRLARMGTGGYSGSTTPPVELIDADFSANNGDVAGGKIVRVANMTVVPSNIWDDIDGTDVVSTDAGERGIGGGPGAYDVTLTNVIAMCFQKQAVGTVKLRDLMMGNQYFLSHGGNLTVAKYAMGHGILRPECAVTLKNLA